MTATYTDYTFNVDNGRWPSNVFSQPYSNQYYHTNGQNLYGSNLKTNQLAPYITKDDDEYYFRLLHYRYHHPPERQPTPEPIRPVAIRRHEPGSTDPPIGQLPISIVLLAPIFQPVTQQLPSEPVLPSEATPQLAPIPQFVPVQSHPSVLPSPVDPTDRPIKPMKDTSIYNNPDTSEKTTHPKKSLPPLKPIKSLSRRESGTFRLPPKSAGPSTHNQSVRIQSASKPPQSPLNNHSDRLQSASKPVQTAPSRRSELLPLPPSRIRMNNVSARRPIRTDIKTMFDHDDDPPPPQRNEHRQMPAQEYYDNGNNHRVSYTRSAPRRMISYQQAPFEATQEMENYQMPRARRLVRVRQTPPVEPIAYQN